MPANRPTPWSTWTTKSPTSRSARKAAVCSPSCALAPHRLGLGPRSSWSVRTTTRSVSESQPAWTCAPTTVTRHTGRSSRRSCRDARAPRPRRAAPRGVRAATTRRARASRRRTTVCTARRAGDASLEFRARASSRGPRPRGVAARGTTPAQPSAPRARWRGSTRGSRSASGARAARPLEALEGASEGLRPDGTSPRAGRAVASSSALSASGRHVARREGRTTMSCASSGR